MFTSADRRKLDRILYLMSAVAEAMADKEGVRAMAPATIDWTAITQAVADETTVDGSAAALIGNLAAQFKAISAQSPKAIQAQLTALAAQLESNKAGLSAAVLANTPAAATTSAATAEATAAPTSEETVEPTTGG